MSKGGEFKRISRAGAVKRPGHAYVRVFLDENKSTHVNYRLIGADLDKGVYGSAQQTLKVHYVMGDAREEEVRAALTAHCPVPPLPLGGYEPTVALAGIGWKHIVEHDDPADPAGHLFEVSRFFGTPSLEEVLTLWERIEPGGAQRMLAHDFPGLPPDAVIVYHRDSEQEPQAV